MKTWDASFSGTVSSFWVTGICHSFYLSSKLGSSERKKEMFQLKKKRFLKFHKVCWHHSIPWIFNRHHQDRRLEKKIRLWYLGIAGVGRRVLTPSENGYGMLCGRFPLQSPRHLGALRKLQGEEACPHWLHTLNVAGGLFRGMDGQPPFPHKSLQVFSSVNLHVMQVALAPVPCIFFFLLLLLSKYFSCV